MRVFGCTPKEIFLDQEIDKITIFKDGDDIEILNGYQSDVIALNKSEISFCFENQVVLKIKSLYEGVLSVEKSNVNIALFEYEKI